MYVHVHVYMCLSYIYLFSDVCAVVWSYPSQHGDLSWLGGREIREGGERVAVYMYEVVKGHILLIEKEREYFK